MTDEFRITTVTNNIILDAAPRQGKAVFTVTNGLELPFSGQAQLEMVANGSADWLTLEGQPIRDFEVKGVEQFTVNINVPPDAEVGDNIFRLNMVGVDNPDEHFSEGPTVTFSVPQPVKPVKKPFPWWIVAVVVVVLIVGGGLVYFFSSRKADLSVSVNASADSVIAGENLTYMIEVTNNGAGKATGFVLTDTLPVGVTLLSTSFTDCQSNDVDGLVVCPLDELAADDTLQIDVQVQVDGGTRGSLNNAVFVGGETDVDEISDLITTEVLPEVTLSIDLSGPASVEADGELVYTAVTHNNGPSQANDILILFQPPPGALEVNFAGQDGECQPNEGALFCALGSLDVGNEKTLTITLVTGPESVGNLVTAVTVVSSESEPVISQPLTTEVQPVTGLSVTVEPLNSPVVQQTLTYAIQVWNNNPNRDAENVILSYILPEGADFVATRPDCLRNATLVRCDLGVVASGIEAAKRIEIDLLPILASELASHVEIVSSNFPRIQEDELTAVERSFSSTGVAFNGTDAWVELQDFNIPETFTVEMWVHPNSNADQQAFIGKHTASGGNIFLIGYWEGGLHVNIRNKNYTAGFKPTELYHLAVVVEKRTLAQSIVTVYKNGEIFWTEEFASVLGGNISGKPWVFGQDWDNNSLTDFYDGKMTEVRIWDHARSQAEIQSSMNVRLAGQEEEAGLLGYWPLDARSGTVVSDRSGNGLDGQLRGNAAWVANQIIIMDPIFVPQLEELMPFVLPLIESP